LESYGYQLVVSNISDHGLARDYEDWWVHPLYATDEIRDFILNDSSDVVNMEKYMLNLGK
jgi:hypothetical protein